MKIACPSCGMHFDVDSGSLDRYFRCTECKNLFLGLNAKSVKDPQYVVKEGENSDGVDDASADVLSAVEGEDSEKAAVAEKTDADTAPEAEADEEESTENDIIHLDAERDTADAGEDGEVLPEAEEPLQKSDDTGSFEYVKISFNQILAAVGGLILLLIIVAAIAILNAHSRIADLRESNDTFETSLKELQFTVKQLEERLSKTSGK